MKKEGRLVSIDLLRTIAIFLVVGFHLVFDFNHDISYRGFGFVGISLFFIISGFVLAKKYPKKESFSLKWFLKRLLKIICIYYLALIVVALLFGRQVYSGNVFLNLLSHFLFLDFINPTYSYSFISPAWFLVPLVFFYLLYPYLNKYVSKERGFLILAFFVTVAARVVYASYTSYNPIFFLAEFSFGIAIAKGRRTEALILSLLTIFVLPIMVIPFLLFYFLSNLNDRVLPKKALAFIGSSTLIIFLFHESFMKTALGRWHVFGLSTVPSLILLTIFTAVAIYSAKKLEKYFLNKRYFKINKTLKNKNPLR